MSKVHKVLLSGIVLCFVVLLMGQSTGPYFSIRVRPVTDGNLIVFDGTSGFFGRDGGAPAGGGTNTLQEVLTKSSDAGGLVVTNLLPEAYGSAWDGKQETPTKDAVYDKIETISGSSLFAGSGTTGTVTSTGGDAGKYLKADATWDTPAGGSTFTNTIAVSGLLGLTGAATSGDNTINLPQATLDVIYVPLTRTLTAGDGLAGGGSLAANRSFAVDGSVLRTNDAAYLYMVSRTSTWDTAATQAGTAIQRDGSVASTADQNGGGFAWSNITEIVGRSEYGVVVRSGTTDGADTGNSTLGMNNPARGGYIKAVGNESGWLGGCVYYALGNVAGSKHTFRDRSGTQVGVYDPDLGYWIFSTLTGTNITARGTLTVEGTANLTATNATHLGGVIAASYLQNVVEDTTPELGGDLNCLYKSITNADSITGTNITAYGTIAANGGNITSTGELTIDSGGALALDADDGYFVFKEAGTILGRLWTDATFAQNVFFTYDASGNQLVLGNVTALVQDFDHAATTDPTLFIHSDTLPNTANDEWISFTHNKTDGVLNLGSGAFDLSAKAITNLLPEAYGAAWDGKQETPTKDAVYDEMETRVDSAGDTITGALLLDDDASLQMDATADGMADDKYNGITMTGKNAGEAITLWDCVFMQADGKFDQADATTGSGEFPAWGIACNATGDGTNLVVLTSGVVRNEGWTGLTIAGAVYLSETTGGITQTAPSTSGDCIQVVGFAISDSEILFNFNNVWSEVE